jgi:hypothetical protein
LRDLLDIYVDEFDDEPNIVGVDEDKLKKNIKKAIKSGEQME